LFTIEKAQRAEAWAPKDIEVEIDGFVDAPTNPGVAAELDLS
jgi:hypothetical protein